jgi:LysM repeat protein
LVHFVEEKMTKKIVIIAAIGITFIFLISACTRSASLLVLSTPTAEPTSESEQPTTISLVQEWGTSTAVYIQTAEAMGLITPGLTTEVQPSDLTTTPMVATAEFPLPGSGTATPLPVSTPTVVVPTITPGRPTTYTMQKGDQPYCIARRLNVDQNELLTVNGLTTQSAGNLPIGYVLQIPQTGDPFVGSRTLIAHPAQYSVNVGDTLNSIACAFGDVEPYAIAIANNLTLNSPLTVGQNLYIP